MSHDTSTSAVSRVAVLTVSDTRSLDEDKSGEKICVLLKEAGHVVIGREVVKDVAQIIQSAITKWADSHDIEAVIVTGGTGPSVRDVTPNAIVPMFSSRMPGFGELFRQLSYQEIGPAAMLSRADAGWIDAGGQRKPIFMLPGSEEAVRLALEALILPQLGHLVDLCQLESTS